MNSLTRQDSVKGGRVGASDLPKWGPERCDVALASKTVLRQASAPQPRKCSPRRSSSLPSHHASAQPHPHHLAQGGPLRVSRGLPDQEEPGVALPGSSSPPGSFSKPHPRWRPGHPPLSSDSRGLRQPRAALGSGGIHSPPVPAGIRAGCHRLRAAAAAGPAPESERERGCECAQRPAVGLCVSCVCGVARACVSVSVRVRADTATPASRRAGLLPAEGPDAGRGASEAGDHCVCRSVRPSGSFHRPLRCRPSRPSAGCFHGHKRAPRHTPRGGGRAGLQPAAAVAPCEAAAPRTAEPRAPAERASRPRPASGTSHPAVSRSTPPPPPPVHSTAGGKVAPGAAPVRGQPHP